MAQGALSSAYGHYYLHQNGQKIEISREAYEQKLPYHILLFLNQAAVLGVGFLGMRKGWLWVPNKSGGKLRPGEVSLHQETVSQCVFDQRSFSRMSVMVILTDQRLIFKMPTADEDMIGEIPLDSIKRIRKGSPFFSQVTRIDFTLGSKYTIATLPLHWLEIFRRYGFTVEDTPGAKPSN